MYRTWGRGYDEVVWLSMAADPTVEDMVNKNWAELSETKDRGVDRIHPSYKEIIVSRMIMTTLSPTGSCVGFLIAMTSAGLPDLRSS